MRADIPAMENVTGVSKFREMREERGWSRTEAAFRCGISEQYWSAIEAGRKQPTRSALVKIAYGFEKTVEEIQAMGGNGAAA